MYKEYRKDFEVPFDVINLRRRDIYSEGITDFNVEIVAMFNMSNLDFLFRRARTFEEVFEMIFGFLNNKNFKVFENNFGL